MGGPLLWPRDEPWPRCTDDHEHGGDSPMMVPVLQLFAADVPELPFPSGTDLLQLLWCPPREDGDLDDLSPILRWRDSSLVVDVLATPPAPDDAEPDYLPLACVLHPERVTDYASHDLPKDLWNTLTPRFRRVQEETSWSYFYHLSVSAGIKVGGYPTWTQDPQWPDCPTCGKRMEHLLTVNSAEFDGESWRTWLAVEDTPATGTIWDLPYQERAAIQCAHNLTLGDMGGIYIFDCRHCPERPYAHRSDCS